MYPPRPLSEAGVLVESTYGNRKHSTEDPEKLLEVIITASRRGEVIMFAAFAVGRAER